MKMNGEKGQALALVMIAVMLGALVIPPFLGHVDSSLIGSRTYAEAIHSEYACDSGVEDAIWNVTNNNTMLNLLSSPGSSITYTLGEMINSLSTNVTISNAWQPIASDNFESGGWTGGTGWLDNWTHSPADSSVTSGGGPQQGTYHLMLTNGDGFAKRSVNLFQQISIHLRFWAKTVHFQPGNSATCQVSSDNVSWTSVKTWTSDTVYTFYDIPLSSYQMTSRFWISFNANMTQSSDHLYIDQLDIIWETPYPTTIAWDKFNTSSWSGGAGWIDNWKPSGTANVAANATAPHGTYEGPYHLRLQNTGDVRRSVDLSASGIIVHLKFWAKVIGVEGNEVIRCQVSSDNITWSTVQTWDKNFPYQYKNIYRSYDINLSTYDLTSRFWIRFVANLKHTSDYFYADDIRIVNLDFYTITATAGGRVIKAVVQINDTAVIVRYWYFV
jgi:hypothetical protein